MANFNDLGPVGAAEHKNALRQAAETRKRKRTQSEPPAQLIACSTKNPTVEKYKKMLLASMKDPPTEPGKQSRITATIQRGVVIVRITGGANGVIQVTETILGQDTYACGLAIKSLYEVGYTKAAVGGG